MKEVVVISGKGGTGKTSVTASFAVLGGKDLVIGDCDVDAADMHLLLKPDYGKTEDFYSGFMASIDGDKCISCGKCEEICRFGAVSSKDGIYKIKELDCEGCGYCAEVCPAEAISMNDAHVGELYTSEIKTGSTMIHARLKPGADNSGKLVAQVKKDARAIAERDGKSLILVDGSPGIGCPVISSLTGADYVILVTEPTPSGIHDLKRVYELISKFKIKGGLIINKCDINETAAQQLHDFAESEDMKVLAEIPYEPDFTKAMTVGKTVTEYDNKKLRDILEDAWFAARYEITTEERV